MTKRQDRARPCRLHVLPPSVLGWPRRLGQVRGTGQVGPAVGRSGVSPLVLLIASLGPLRGRHETLEALHQQRVDVIADTSELEAGVRVTGSERIECPA